MYMIDEKDKGRRVELVKTEDPYTSLKAGSRGTYEFKNTVDMGNRELMIQHSIKWDNGSNLMLIQEFGRNASAHDQFRFIE